MNLEKAFQNIINSHEFTFTCPKCKKPVKVALADDGAYVKCPNCNSDIKVEVNRH